MTVSAGKLGGGLLVLVGVWIAVYWLWDPSQPKITYSTSPAVSGAAPIKLEPPHREAPPPSLQARPVPALETPPAQAQKKPEPVVPPPAPAPKKIVEAAPQPRQAVKPPEFWEYQVGGGETLQTISKHFYGTPDYATAIAKANPLMDPTKLRGGRTIRIPVDPTNIQGIPQTDIKPAPPRPAPRVADAAKSSPQAPSKPVPARRTYKVQEGDTLSEIAERFLGSQNKAKLLFEANRDKLKSENDLKIGVELVIPDVAAGTPNG